MDAQGHRSGRGNRIEREDPQVRVPAACVPREEEVLLERLVTRESPDLRSAFGTGQAREECRLQCLCTCVTVAL